MLQRRNPTPVNWKSRKSPTTRSCQIWCHRDVSVCGAKDIAPPTEANAQSVRCASQKLGNGAEFPDVEARTRKRHKQTMKHHRNPHLTKMLREGFTAFVDDNALSRGAAIAFYAVTAIAPVLFVTTAIAGLVLGPKAASA